MLKQIQQGFSKFFTMERIIVLAVFLVLAYGLIMYSGSKSMVVDRMTDYNSNHSIMNHVNNHEQNKGADHAPAPYVAPPVVPHAAEEPKAHESASGFSSHSVANPSDLLPKDQNSEWAGLNPNTMNKGDMLMPDLLQAGYHIGLDTVGQTLRNANLQLRSDPIIPKSNVGPWHQSTIEPDLGRVPLEIGEGNR
jgi:hypothetical protein